ncbi:hypothetical protein GLYMA_06G079700v4 [Glycine max]|uniref:Uncharacterized protein n=1 Tax=Glycine max TaxID=3847 RepID=A0A0R0JJV1_SOYBN|nr:hypothetical protein JHK86_014697 [Glycine max]KAH1124719.1 hypothetical protein GYH30_014418 [Glycine max]KRH52635.1 hypothetical protein GLYMA_06G079700v4 [Glycine max]
MLCFEPGIVYGVTEHTVFCFCVYQFGSLFVYVVASNCSIIYSLGRLTFRLAKFVIEVLKLILQFIMGSWSVLGDC